MDNSVARAERYRDALHDLPDYDAAQEAQIMERAEAMALEAYARLDRDTVRDEWIERHIDDYRAPAIDALGLLHAED